MKKILILLLLPLLFLSCTTKQDGEKNVIAQKKILEQLIPELREAPHYVKFKRIFARAAVAGEEIITVTSDGEETRNTAAEGDFVVRNQTDAKEMYIIKGEKFSRKYRLFAEKDGTFDIYEAVGEIMALEVDKGFLKKNDLSSPFYFMASWGKEMVCKKGDFLVSPTDLSEVYRIAQKEFFETYKLK